MSTDSSNPPPTPSRTPLAGWRAAFLSLTGALLTYLLAPVIAAVALMAYGTANGWSEKRISDWLTNSVSAQFFYILIAEVLTVLVVWWLLKRFRWTWRSIGMKKPQWYDPLFGIAALLPYFALFFVALHLVSTFVPGFDANQQQEIGFNSVHGTVAMVLTFISLVILPPLAEEIVMRGFLYTGLRKWLPRIVAIVAVSVLFGAAHLAEGGAAGPLWVGALDTCILSFVLLGLRELTGNLWAGITLHMAKNLIAFFALFVFIGR